MKTHEVIAARYRSHLRRLRQKQGLSQTTLASIMGTTSAYISDLEAGRRSPSLALIELTARAFDVDVSELIKEVA